MHPKLIGVALIIATSLLTSACSDWYLRGTRKSDFDVRLVFLEAENARHLQGAVNRELSYNGISRTNNKGAAEAVIALTDETFDRRVLSVDPDTGKVREIELGLEVLLTVRDRAGRLLAAPRRLDWVQDFVFDESSLLGTGDHELRIRRELAEDAAQSIIRHLESIDLSAVTSG